MKILALGGCGDMGRMAIAILLESPKVTSITVADIDIELAKTYIKLIGSEKLSAVQIDVTHRDKLVELIKSHDIILNTIGPYFKFGKLIFEAVLEAKKDYIDICDDWKPMLEILEMDEKAKNADITAIVGMGASPGISNLLAMHVCAQLDEIDDVITAWGISLTQKAGKRPIYYIKKRKLMKKLNRKSPKANAAIIHLLHESIGKIPIYKDNKLVEIEALTEAETLTFPGYKKMYACHIGHPEPVTLCRNLNASSISNLMFIGKNATDVTRKFAKKIANNQLSIQEAAIKIEKRFYLLILKYLILFWKIIKEFYNAPPDLCAVVTGKKNGKQKRIGIGLIKVPYRSMAGVTGVPLAIGALMIIDGTIDKKGVLTPEESIDFNEFFERLAPYCGKNLTKKDILVIREEDI
ncbi:MAG: saccharopine dehydrogenase family protein [Promethearchaeota archaeon]